MNRGTVRKILEQRIEWLHGRIVQRGDLPSAPLVAERNAMNWLRFKLFDVPETEGWQPIETAPTDGRDVVVLWGSRTHGDIGIANYSASVNGGPAWLRNGVPLFNVTHWLETPVRPTRNTIGLKTLKRARREGALIRENAPENAKCSPVGIE